MTRERNRTKIAEAMTSEASLKATSHPVVCTRDAATGLVSLKSPMSRARTVNRRSARPMIQISRISRNMRRDLGAGMRVRSASTNRTDVDHHRSLPPDETPSPADRMVRVGPIMCAIGV